MLTPLQSGQSLAVVSTMQSILDNVEDRRREETEKQSGRKDDAARQVSIQPDASARQANARINEHFFGNNARGEETIATLISRISQSLGISQQADETSRAFAQRLADMVALVGAASASGPITLTGIGTTLDNVKLAMGGGKTDDSIANLVARLGFASGTVQGEGESDADFETRLTSTLDGLRKHLPKSVESLEKQTGLADLGIAISDLIAAIKNPYGSEAAKVKDALAEKARDEKSLTPEMRKVIARLEDTANPKTIEELKLERTRSDPTRVEDAETRQEREETIRALEAGEKLEDVIDLHEAVGKANDAHAAGEGKTDAAGAPQDAVTAALATIQILAAGMEAIETSEAADKAGGENSAGAILDKETKPEATEDSLKLLDEAAALADEAKENAQKELFVLRVDDNGLYDLITRQLVAY
jgi:hypothetical protein